MKKLTAILKKCLDVFAFCLGFRGTETEKEAIKNNLVSREGQGRDKYGN